MINGLPDEIAILMMAETDEEIDPDEDYMYSDLEQEEEDEEDGE